DILILVFNSTANVGAVKTQRRHLTGMEALIVVSWSSITRTTKNVTTVETNCAQELNFQIMSTELFMQVCYCFRPGCLQASGPIFYLCNPFTRHHTNCMTVLLSGVLTQFSNFHVIPFYQHQNPVRTPIRNANFIRNWDYVTTQM
ncbi:unnamed protein product, partial [Porites evermanni]